MKNKLFQYIMLLACLILFENTVYAGVISAPERHILELSPNEEATVEYEIFNSGPEDINIKIESKYWSHPDTEKEIPLSSWFMPEDEEFSINVNETKNLKVKIKAPEGIEGEIVAMMYLCYKEIQDSQLNIRKGSPVYLTIKDTQSHDLKIDNVDIAYFKDKERNNDYCLQVSVFVKNLGNIHAKPDIDVFIKQKDKLVRKLDIKNGWPVFRNEIYKYDLQWWRPKLEQDSLYSINIKLSYKNALKPVEAAVNFKFINNKAEIIG